MDRRYKRMIKSFSKHNDPPSEAQRFQIVAMLEHLKSEFHTLTVRYITDSACSTPRPTASALSKQVRTYEKYIPLHQSILSHVRTFPLELWQRIFFFLVKGREGYHRYADANLRAVCKVSQNWRLAATTHHILWTQLPPLRIVERNHPLRKLIHNACEIRLYLSRSGVLPITIDYEDSQYLWHSPTKRVKEQVRENLRLLTDQCHRWGVVSNLCLPVDAFTQDPLLSIQGKLPVLRKIRRIEAYPVVLSTSDMFQAEPEVLDVTCFSDAPLLRQFGHSNGIIGYQTINFLVPWSLIESVEIDSVDGSQGGQLFKSLIQAQPPNLKTLKCIQYLPYPPIALGSALALPKLELLDFRFMAGSSDDPSRSLGASLPRLCLPSLTDLRLTGRLEAGQNQVLQSIITMIENSGCSQSLKRLDLSGLASTRETVVSEVLFLTPNLTHLNLPIPIRSLSELSLCTTEHQEPILPNLRSLTIGWDHFGHYLDAMARIDAADLMRMVHSRTVELASGADELRLFQVLEEVCIQIPATPRVVSQLIKDWRFIESRNLPAQSCSALTDLATEVGRFLKENCWEHAVGTLKQCRELDAMIRRLEMLDLHQFPSVEVVIRSSIPYLLHKISQESRPGAIPGDRLFQIQPRAKRLYEQWKPLLLRDASRSPFSWTLSEGGKRALLRYQPKVLDEDERWTHILTTEL